MTRGKPLRGHPRTQAPQTSVCRPPIHLKDLYAGPGSSRGNTTTLSAVRSSPHTSAATSVYSPPIHLRIYTRVLGSNPPCVACFHPTRGSLFSPEKNLHGPVCKGGIDSKSTPVQNPNFGGKGSWRYCSTLMYHLYQVYDTI